MKIGRFTDRDKIEKQNHIEKDPRQQRERHTEKYRKKTDDRWTERDRILMMHR